MIKDVALKGLCRRSVGVVMHQEIGFLGRVQGLHHCKATVSLKLQ